MSQHNLEDRNIKHVPALPKKKILNLICCCIFSLFDQSSTFTSNMLPHKNPQQYQQCLKRTCERGSSQSQNESKHRSCHLFVYRSNIFQALRYFMVKSIHSGKILYLKATYPKKRTFLSIQEVKKVREIFLNDEKESQTRKYLLFSKQCTKSRTFLLKQLL